jgi:REP element-mobilizing transposase RayT
MAYRFGTIKNEEMISNEYGSITYYEWIKLPERFPNFELDVFQIMPNHMHGIIILNDLVVGVGFTPTQNKKEQPEPEQNEQSQKGQPQGIAPTMNATVGDIVGAYKSLVANACLEIHKSKNETMDKLWQRNYYEHIIRNKQLYNRISKYIINNPANWNADKFLYEDQLTPTPPPDTNPESLHF